MKLIQRIFGHLVLLALCSAFVAYMAFILSNRITPSETDPTYPFVFRVEPRNYITKSSDSIAGGLRTVARKLKRKK